MDHPSWRTQFFRDQRATFPTRCHPDHPVDHDRPAGTASGRAGLPYPDRCRPDRLRPPLDERQRGLATRYLPLARALARRLTSDHPEWRDEFQSAAFLALVEAAQHFDSARNVDFATYAQHRIWGAIRDARRQLVRNGMPGREAAPKTVIRMGEAAERHGRIINAEPDDPIGTEIEVRETVETWIERLPRAHSATLRLIYLDGHTQEQVAEEVGCSKANISRLHQQGLRWLRYGHGSGHGVSTTDAMREVCA